MTSTTPKLGEGIFTAYDAAHILNIKYGRVNYWFNNQIKEQFRKSSGHDYFFDYQNIRAVNFFSLIELYALQSLRKLNYSTAKIIKYHTFLSNELGTPYPFATSKWLIGGKEIVLSLDDQDSQFITADESHQLFFQDIILPYTKRIVFDLSDGLACKYYPIGEDRSVVVNRNNQFGQPIIEGTNVKVSTIYSYFLGGESKAAIAELYHLTESQVADAIDYSRAA